MSALAIGTGTMIAAGIFTLSGLAISYVGSAAIASFLLAALVASLTALSYCEFASIYPQSGEGYLYARKTFSPPAASRRSERRAGPRGGELVRRAAAPGAGPVTL